MRTLLLAVLWAGMWTTSHGQVEVARDATLRETQLTIMDGDCRITWTLFENELNAGVIRHRSQCTLDLTGQAPLLRALLRRAMEEPVVAQRFRTLSWGRLVPDGARDFTLGVRLAIAAKKAGDWSARTGQPVKGGREAWVARALEEGHLYEELRAAFATEGWRLQVASTEKALVLPAGKLPFFAQLRAAGVRATDLVPFDAQLWFRVERAPAQ